MTNQLVQDVVKMLNQAIFNYVTKIKLQTRTLMCRKYCNTLDQLFFTLQQSCKAVKN